MMATLDAEEGRRIERPPIKVGDTYRFYSTLQGIDGCGIYPCLYSAQEVVVVRWDEENHESWEAEQDWPERERETEPLYIVRADDGAEFSAWEGELNGWFFDTGQWHGPFACEVGPSDKPADFKTNNQHRKLES